MEFDFFLWPMLVPMILPVVFCLKYRKESLGSVVAIAAVMGCSVVAYWPLLTSDFLYGYTYEAVKILLFILLPLGILFLLKSKEGAFSFSWFGIQRAGVKKSLLLCGAFLPVMLLVTVAIQSVNGVGWQTDSVAGLMSFFEAFTEEFFFRGVLFIFLLKKTEVWVAYVTSLTCFVLMHPQQLTSVFLLGTVVQGVLTIEITRRSKNMIGSWVLHGSNRLFQLVFLPFLL